ncbi:MAG: Crp/Fnr family transcriptional regulator [Candidatus Promineifilaceae bacterium]|jgi:CRP/FNR family cyclic AMP-dependent transcriptional regulator
MAEPGSDRTVRSFLAKLPLFENLEEEVLSALVQKSRSRQIPKGSILFFQHDPADGYYILYTGSIAIYVSSSDGRELVLGEMRPGDCFGELALITGQTRSTSAIALRKSEVIILPNQHFLDLINSQPDMLRILLLTLAKRFYGATQRESALAFLDAPARLARILLQLAATSEAPGGYITISQLQLARRAGLTRQTVAKILGRWRRAGWLLTGRGRVVLLDIPALEQVEFQTTF